MHVAYEQSQQKMIIIMHDLEMVTQLQDYPAWLTKASIQAKTMQNVSGLLMIQIFL